MTARDHSNDRPSVTWDPPWKRRWYDNDARNAGDPLVRRDRLPPPRRTRRPGPRPGAVLPHPPGGSVVRYYKLTGTEGGPLPPHEWLKVGAVIRVARSNARKPGHVWNPDTCNWVTPIWTECADPSRRAAS